MLDGLGRGDRFWLIGDQTRRQTEADEQNDLAHELASRVALWMGIVCVGEQCRSADAVTSIVTQNRNDATRRRIEGSGRIGRRNNQIGHKALTA
jgi:hypothetical protein